MTAPLGNVPPVLPHPAAPNTLAEAGLSLDLLVQLVLKHLHFAGELTGSDLARRVGLRVTVLEPALEQLRSQYQLEVAGGSMLGPASFRYRITDAGRSRVTIFLENNRYVGAAPVPLAQYCRYLLAWSSAVPHTVTREGVGRAFSHLVLGERVLDQLGPAVSAGHSLFVYGAPGNGKTVIARAIRALLEGDIAVPHALEVEGQIVKVFDPVNHEPLPMPPGEGLVDDGLDQRWVRCRRPLVMVGGELTLAALELTYTAVSGFYQAPVQALANGGVLIIDDFGRQASPAAQFLNRWIVPLENRVDFLTLQTGQKFAIPFLPLLVLATNLSPGSLVDEAFLRRIRYKVFAESPTVEEFASIFERYCQERGVEYDRAMLDRLLHDYFRPRRIALRGCQPRDLIEQALSLAAYLGEPPRLTTELLEAACATYFVDDREAAPTYA